MRSKFKLIILTPIFLIAFVISNYGQIESNSNGNYSVSKIEKKLDNINLEIFQYKLNNQENPSFPSCKAKIYILKNNIKIDSINFSEIEPVGGNYGLRIYSSIIENHLLVTKYGDYEGLTIIINKNGEKFITDGGFAYLDRSRKLLFSISASDSFGISVFDLKLDSEILYKYDLEDEPIEFYKKNERYFFKAANYNSEKDSFYEINLKNKTIVKNENIFESTEYQIIEKLIDWEDVKNISCE